MAVAVDDVRTAAMRARVALHRDNDCELCRKPLAEGRGEWVAIDHENSEFVAGAEAEARGDAVSLFLVGADCARRIKRALKAEG